MPAKIDAFLAKIRARPAFVAAANSDGSWYKHLDAIERGLSFLDRKADDDPQIIEILDKIQSVVARDDLSLKERLLEVGKFFVQIRDAGRSVN